MKLAIHAMKKIVLISSYFLLLISCSDNNHSLALGTLERDRILLRATAAEIITQVSAVEGSDVKAGDLLLALDATNQTAVVAHAKANLTSATANLRKLQNGARGEDIAAARSQVQGTSAQLIEAGKNFERANKLFTKKLIGEAEVDAARAKHARAQADAKKAQENLLLLTNGNREEDIAQGEALVAVAQAELDLQQHKLNELQVKATRDARLDHLPKHQGERVNTGDIVAILLANSAPYARIYVPETYRIHIKNGTQLKIHVDGLKETVEGRVRWVSQEPSFTPYYALNSRDKARLVYLTEVQLPDTTNDLPSGLPVEVQLPSE
jgi:HlyD family secretion protein